MAKCRRRFVSCCNVILTFGLSAVAWAVPADQPLIGINVEGFSDVKSEMLNWDKNPFVQPLKETDVSALRVSMIVYHPDFSAALINGEVLREGDRMGAVEVVKIHPKHVILRSEDGIFRLELTRGAPEREK